MGDTARAPITRILFRDLVDSHPFEKGKAALFDEQGSRDRWFGLCR
jgi:hypothetical protein